MTAATETDRSYETKHRALWALGNYGAVASEVAAPLGPVLVRASGIGAGDRVLDVAAGTGNASASALASSQRRLMPRLRAIASPCRVAVLNSTRCCPVSA
jgi:hypothetical protein